VAGATINHLSTQYILASVRAWSGGVPYNPSALPVQMAFVNGWSPPGTWNTASWAWTTAQNGYYAAQCLVGPGSGGVDLAIGTYDIWLMVTGSPEIPVLVCGTLVIT
jgi:hypothetical protein